MSFWDTIASIFSRLKQPQEVGSAPPAPAPAPATPIDLYVDGVRVRKLGDAVVFQAGLQLDWDGAPNAYHPKGSPPGMDGLKNAGHPGNWWGIATDTGKDDGVPVVQGPNDPCPGFYVPTTAYTNYQVSHRSTKCYVDASKVPYVSLPEHDKEGPGRVVFAVKLGLRLGDFGVALFKDKWSPFIYADVGPDAKVGEGSPALAQAIGTWVGKNNVGHDAKDVTFVIFGNSKKLIDFWNKPWDETERFVSDYFTKWGGPSRLRAIASAK